MRSVLRRGGIEVVGFNRNAGVTDSLVTEAGVTATYSLAQLVEGTQQQALLVPQRAVTRNEKGEPTALVVGAGDKIEMRTLQAPRTIGAT